MLIDRLIKRIHETAPIVVGLDLQLEQMPHYLKEEKLSQYGRTPQAVAEIFFEFNEDIIDAVCDIVPVVKPQIAMYEKYGVDGIDCYHRTVEYAKRKGLFVIGDVKRGDIASTARGYSTAHIGHLRIEDDEIKTVKADFITINPFLGYDAVEPFLSDCKAYDKGLFILVKTSNAGSGDIQDLILQNGKPLYSHVGGLVKKWGEPFTGETGFSAIGAVVGATHPEEAAEIRKNLPDTFFLVPGYGAQGASGKDLKNIWTENYGAVISSSRGITAAYQTEKFACDEKDFALAAREAALDMKADLEAYM